MKTEDKKWVNNAIEEDHKWVKATVEDKMKHSESSPQTVLMFKSVDGKLDGLKELFEERFKQNDKDHDSLIKKVEAKASKWTEGVLKMLMAGVGLWVLNQILNLIPTVEALIWPIQ